VDHARQLVQQDQQASQPCGALLPLVEAARQGVLDQVAEQRLGFGIVMLAEPQRALLASHGLGAGAPTEPPLQQRLPRCEHGLLLVVRGDALDLFLRAEEHRHALVQASGLMSRMRWWPSVDAPPACSTMNDIGLASYIRRSLPGLLGSRRRVGT
jgi:hypothetical protein